MEEARRGEAGKWVRFGWNFVFVFFFSVLGYVVLNNVIFEWKIFFGVLVVDKRRRFGGWYRFFRELKFSVSVRVRYRGLNLIRCRM